VLAHARVRKVGESRDASVAFTPINIVERQKIDFL